MFEFFRITVNIFCFFGDDARSVVEGYIQIIFNRLLYEIDRIARIARIAVAIRNSRLKLNDLKKQFLLRK